MSFETAPCVLFRAGGVRRMLVGAGDRGIHADPPVNFPGSIRLGQQPAQRPVPGAVPGVVTVAPPHRLPRTEHLPRQVTPRNPGPIPVDDSLHRLAVVAERVAPPARVRRQQRLDPLPLLITQRAKPRPSPRHPSRLPPGTSQICETRSRRPGCRLGIPQTRIPLPQAHSPAIGNPPHLSGTQTTRLDPPTRARAPLVLPAHWPAVPAGTGASRLATSRARCW